MVPGSQAPSCLSSGHRELLLCQGRGAAACSLSRGWKEKAEPPCWGLFPLLRGREACSSTRPQGRPARPASRAAWDKNKAKEKEKSRGRWKGREHRASSRTPSGAGAAAPAFTRRHLCPADLPAPPREKTCRASPPLPAPGNYGSQQAPRRHAGLRRLPGRQRRDSGLQLPACQRRPASRLPISAVRK